MASSIGMGASALFAASIRKPESRPATETPSRLTRDVAEGLRFVFGDRLLRPTLLAEGVFNLFLVFYQTMLLVHLARNIGLGSLGIGLVLSAMGCGSVLGALAATRIADRLGSGPIIWLAPLLTCPLTALMPLARPDWSLYPATIGLMCLSLGGVIRGVVQASLQQALTPDRLLGRMSATARLVSSGVMPLGGLLGGASGAMFGTTTTLWIGAAGMTLSFLPGFASPLRRMRRLPAATADEAPGPTLTDR